MSSLFWRVGPAILRNCREIYGEAWNILFRGNAKIDDIGALQSSTESRAFVSHLPS